MVDKIDLERKVLEIPVRRLADLTKDIRKYEEQVNKCVLNSIPPNIRMLPEGIPKISSLTPWPFGDSSYQGINDFGNIGYGGPCPPPGRPHRYLFKVYALDTKLPLSPGSSKSDVEKAMINHILAKGELIGTYSR